METLKGKGGTEKRQPYFRSRDSPHCCQLGSIKESNADVTSAYFQALPLDRVRLMRQPRGGLHNVDPEALLLVRVPILYGLSDSGRGSWVRLDREAKSTGFKSSSIFPSFYYFPDPDEAGECVALMTTHVDDLLIAHTPKGVCRKALREV